MKIIRIITIIIAVVSYIYTAPNIFADGHGGGMGGHGKHGEKPHKFVDKDADGICDNIVDKNMDGLCDIHPDDPDGDDGDDGSGGDDGNDGDGDDGHGDGHHGDGGHGDGHHGDGGHKDGHHGDGDGEDDSQDGDNSFGGEGSNDGETGGNDSGNDSDVGKDMDDDCDCHDSGQNGHNNRGMMGGGMMAMNDCFELNQNSPNPFYDNTDISIKVLKGEYFDIKVYDRTGKEVAQLYSGNLKKGEYSFHFQTDYISKGVYFFRVNAGRFVETMKMFNAE